MAVSPLCRQPAWLIISVLSVFRAAGSCGESRIYDHQRFYSCCRNVYNCRDGWGASRWCGDHDADLLHRKCGWRWRRAFQLGGWSNCEYLELWLHGAPHHRGWRIWPDCFRPVLLRESFQAMHAPLLSLFMFSCGGEAPIRFELQGNGQVKVVGCRVCWTH